MKVVYDKWHAFTLTKSGRVLSINKKINQFSYLNISFCCLTVLKLLLEKVCTALTNIPEEAIFPLIDFSGNNAEIALIAVINKAKGSIPLCIDPVASFVCLSKQRNI